MNELNALATEIRAACDAERQALARLDVVRLAEIAETKRSLAARLSALMKGPNPPRGPEAARVVSDIRWRSEIARMLLTDAARTLQSLVGGAEPSTYDRSASLNASPRARLDLNA